MQLSSNNNYTVYIITNNERTVLHASVTSDLSGRLYQHEHEARNNTNSFPAKNGCIYLVYWEHHADAQQALARERQLNSFAFKKKQALISASNPEWRFLNEEVAAAKHSFVKSNQQ